MIISILKGAWILIEPNKERRYEQKRMKERKKHIVDGEKK